MKRVQSVCGYDSAVKMGAWHQGIGACMLVRYCNAACQKSHWPNHKIECRRLAAELRDEALFKDPPDKEDCSICFLPMPTKLIMSMMKRNHYEVCCCMLEVRRIRAMQQLKFEFCAHEFDVSCDGQGRQIRCF